jgi:hypothetical protein
VGSRLLFYLYGGSDVKMDTKEILRGCRQFIRLCGEIRYENNARTYKESNFTKRYERNKEFVGELSASGDEQLRKLSDLLEQLLTDLIAIGSGELTAELEAKSGQLERIMNGLVITNGV